MKDKCTIKRKMQMVQDILDELECIPITRRSAYWFAHIPTVSEDDLELFPDELKDIYLTTKTEIEISLTPIERANLISKGINIQTQPDNNDGFEAMVLLLLIILGFAGFGIYSCVESFIK